MLKRRKHTDKSATIKSRWEFLQTIVSFFHKGKNIPTTNVIFASTGVVFSSISFPYKQRPASKRSTSRTPKPANLASPFFDWSNLSTRFDAYRASTDILNNKKIKNIKIGQTK